MANLMGRGMAMLDRKLSAAAGVTIVYRRGQQEVSIPGVVVGFGTDQTETPGQGKARVDSALKEYLIPRAALVLDGEPAVPKPGDRIVETINGVSLTHEVTPRGDGGPCWRYSDEATQTVFRVRTKQGTKQVF